MHATDGTATAAQEASYSTRRSDDTSAHFYVDAGSIYQAVPLSHIAFGCLPRGNAISVQFEMSGISDHVAPGVVANAAAWVAKVAAAYELPIRHVTPAQIDQGVTGICGHADITAAFPADHGTHTDPGPHFDWPGFLEKVALHSVRLGDVMPRPLLVRQTGTDPVFKADGQTIRWIRPNNGRTGPQSLSDVVYAEHEYFGNSAFPGVTDILDVANLLAFGELIGPDPFAPTPTGGTPSA